MLRPGIKPRSSGKLYQCSAIWALWATQRLDMQILPHIDTTLFPLRLPGHSLPTIEAARACPQEGVIFHNYTCTMKSAMLIVFKLYDWLCAPTAQGFHFLWLFCTKKLPTPVKAPPCIRNAHWLSERTPQEFLSYHNPISAISKCKKKLKKWMSHYTSSTLDDDRREMIDNYWNFSPNPMPHKS